MFAVVTSKGKVLSIHATEAKARITAIRKGQRKGREYRVIPWNC